MTDEEYERDCCIRQIMPAPGWWAVYQGDDGKRFAIPLAGWALSKGGDRIFGLACDGTGLEDVSDDDNLFRLVPAPDAQAAIELILPDEETKGDKIRATRAKGKS